MNIYEKNNTRSHACDVCVHVLFSYPKYSLSCRMLVIELSKLINYCSVTHKKLFKLVFITKEYNTTFQRPPGQLMRPPVVRQNLQNVRPGVMNSRFKMPPQKTNQQP